MFKGSRAWKKSKINKRRAYVYSRVQSTYLTMIKVHKYIIATEIWILLKYKQDNRHSLAMTEKELTTCLMSKAMFLFCFNELCDVKYELNMQHENKNIKLFYQEVIYYIFWLKMLQIFQILPQSFLKSRHLCQGVPEAQFSNEDGFR